jgi:hypothetical protein
MRRTLQQRRRWPIPPTGLEEALDDLQGSAAIVMGEAEFLRFGGPVGPIKMATGAQVKALGAPLTREERERFNADVERGIRAAAGGVSRAKRLRGLCRLG